MCWRNTSANIQAALLVVENLNTGPSSSSSESESLEFKSAVLAVPAVPGSVASESSASSCSLSWSSISCSSISSSEGSAGPVYSPWVRPTPKQHAYLLFGFTLARANARMLINAASKRSSAKNAVRTSRSRSTRMGAESE